MGYIAVTPVRYTFMPGDPLPDAIVGEDLIALGAVEEADADDAVVGGDASIGGFAELEAAIAARERALGVDADNLAKQVTEFAGRVTAADARETVLADRERALDARVTALDEREQAIAAREAAAPPPPKPRRGPAADQG